MKWAIFQMNNLTIKKELHACLILSRINKWNVGTKSKKRSYDYLSDLVSSDVQLWNSPPYKKIKTKQNKTKQNKKSPKTKT